MSPSIRRMLWGAFAGLALLTASGVALTMTVLYMEQRLEYRVVQESGPFVDAVNEMESALSTMGAASRGHLHTGDSSFAAQYDDATRDYDKAEAIAFESVKTRQRDRPTLEKFRAHYRS